MTRLQEYQYKPVVEVRLNEDLPVHSKDHRVFLDEGQIVRIVDGRPVSSYEAINLVSNVADSSAIVNTAVETLYDVACNLDRGASGDKIKISVSGTITDQGTSDTIHFVLYLAGTAYTTTVNATLTGSPVSFQLDYEVILRNASDRSSVSGFVFFKSGTIGATELRPQQTSISGLDLSGAWDVEVAAKFSVAHASNSTTLQNLNIEYYRA